MSLKHMQDSKKDFEKLEALKQGLHIAIDEAVVDINAPWKGALFERKEFAEGLTAIVANELGPTVLALNGCWGCGKTFFLKRWCQQLENEGWHALYFNAWQDDFIQDPLLAIIGQLHRYLESDKCLSIRSGKKLDKAGTIVKNSLAGIVEQITNIDINDLLSVTKYSLCQNVEEYQALLKKRTELIDRLSSLAKFLREQELGKPLVFIVDELDRCRPNFAIETLERIKHIMCVPNVIFVLGIDRAQLGISIRSVYGDTFDVDNYLHRIVDIEFNLPTPEPGDYLRELFVKTRLHDYFVQWSMTYGTPKVPVSDIQQIWRVLFKIHNLSLREIEAASKMLIVCIKLSGARDVYPELTAIMILLRLKQRKLYEDLVLGNMVAKAIVDYLIPDVLAASHDSYEDYVRKVVVYIVYTCFGTQDGNFQYQQLNQFLQSGQSGANDITLPNCIGINISNEYQGWLQTFIEFEHTHPCNRDWVNRVAKRLENFS